MAKNLRALLKEYIFTKRQRCCKQTNHTLKRSNAVRKITSRMHIITLLVLLKSELHYYQQHSNQIRQNSGVILRDKRKNPNRDLIELEKYLEKK
ncbi:hypothetical protein HZS_774 [Henneguya salminicola]|nr:hypothetical protein HZS_774 [Henneguya salminicola]